MPTDQPNSIKTIVQSISPVADGIMAYELIDPAGGQLPAFTAGAHIDVFLENEVIRQYSISNDPQERHRYVIAVLREDGGRGGSIAMHETVFVGQSLTISVPRNNFPLVEVADRHLFLAGGIGITPIRSMIQACRSQGTPFELVYCTRSPDRTAFADELTGQEGVTIHHDAGDPANSFDLAQYLAEHRPGTHLYYCGPAGFMQAVEAASAHWPQGSRHFEYFTVADEVSIGDTVDGGDAFQVKVNSSGAVYDVPADKSIVEVLRENGIDVLTSCESGLCGTCLTKYLEGKPEHHDSILDDDEKETEVLICCARSLSPLLVLDL